MRRRTTPGLFHVAVGHRSPKQPACGLRPGRRQRPGPHAAVPQEPQDLGVGAPCCNHRRLELVSRSAGRTVARGGASIVRLSHHQEHQQAHSGCGAAAADGHEPAGQGRPSSWFWTVYISNISPGKKLRNHKTGVALCALSSSMSSSASWWTVGGRATPAAWNTLPQVPCASSLNRNRFPSCWTSVVCN